MINNGTTTITAARTINSLDGAGALNLGNTLTINNGAQNAGNTYSGVIANNGANVGSVTQAGGTLVLSASNTYTGNTTINSGNFTLADTGSLAGNNLTVGSGANATINGALPATAVVTANGNTSFAGTTGITANTRVMTSMAIGNSTTITINHSTFPFTPTILKPTTTTFVDTSARIDLTNNAFITTGTAATALTLIQSPNQIFSSEPANANMAIGYIDLAGADAGKFEVRYTLKGDSNLDGTVDVGDLGALATSYGITGGQSWANGDFNQDSNVDVGDLGALATNYGSHLATGPSFEGGLSASPLAVVAGGSAAVPEPASLGLLAVGAAGLFGRRRRKA